MFEETLARVGGAALLDALPAWALPALPEPLKPPRGLRSATFDLSFLDRELRVTRGDRGELRVYARDDAAGEELARR